MYVNIYIYMKMYVCINSYDIKQMYLIIDVMCFILNMY